MEKFQQQLEDVGGFEVHRAHPHRHSISPGKGAGV